MEEKKSYHTLIHHILIKTVFYKAISSQKYIAEKPELAKGYNSILKGFLIYGTIPWLIMMVGDLTGLVKSPFEFFDVKGMNPIVLLYNAYFLFLVILGAWWIYMKNGAEFLETHPGLVQRNGKVTPVTAIQVKRFYPLIILGYLIGLLSSWFL